LRYLRQNDKGYWNSGVMIMACSNKLKLYAIELLTALGPYCQLFF